VWSCHNNGAEDSGLLWCYAVLTSKYCRSFEGLLDPEDKLLQFFEMIIATQVRYQSMSWNSRVHLNLKLLRSPFSNTGLSLQLFFCLLLYFHSSVSPLFLSALPYGLMWSKQVNGWITYVDLWHCIHLDYIRRTIVNEITYRSLAHCFIRGMNGISTWFLLHCVKKGKVLAGEGGRIKSRRLVKEGRIKGKGRWNCWALGWKNIRR
jgi:hypothetical protein